MMNTIVLNGTDRTVEVVGLENCSPLAQKAIEVLNANDELKDIAVDGTVEVTQEDNTVTVNGYEYLVFNGYDEAREEAIDDTVDFLTWELQSIKMSLKRGEDIDGRLIELALDNGFVDTEWFAEYWQQVNEIEAWDYTDIEDIATREQLEQLENGEITEEDLREAYEEQLNCRTEGCELDEYYNLLGEQAVYMAILANDLIDLEELASFIVDTDGVEFTLASYDNIELEHDDIYMYRTN